MELFGSALLSKKQFDWLFRADDNSLANHKARLAGCCSAFNSLAPVLKYPNEGLLGYTYKLTATVQLYDMIWDEWKILGCLQSKGNRSHRWLIGVFYCVAERINRYGLFRKVCKEEPRLRILSDACAQGHFISFRTLGRPKRLIRPCDLGFSPRLDPSTFVLQ